MIRGLYLIKDDVAETFDFYGHFVNDEVAKRSFVRSCSSSPEVPIKDLSLYKGGTFDTDTGNIYANSNNIPEYLMRGKKEDEI